MPTSEEVLKSGTVFLSSGLECQVIGTFEDKVWCRAKDGSWGPGTCSLQSVTLEPSHVKVKDGKLTVHLEIPAPAYLPQADREQLDRLVAQFLHDASKALGALREPVLPIPAPAPIKVGPPRVFYHDFTVGDMSKYNLWCSELIHYHLEPSGNGERAELAYFFRRLGKTWAAISDMCTYSGADSACSSAKNWAHKTQSEWPPTFVFNP